MNGILFLGWGFLVWLVATLLLRAFGQFILVPDNPLLLVVTFIVTVPLIAAMTYPLYRWQRLNAEQRRHAAIYLALPGMVLDVLSVLFFSSVFPNMATAADGPFGSWLLWAYALTLITGVFPDMKPQDAPDLMNPTGVNR